MISEIENSSFVAEYQRNGFVVFHSVIDPGLISEARDHVEWLQRRYAGLRPEHLHHPLMRDDAFWVRLVTDERLVDLAQQFLGPDLACFTSHYICKPAGDGQAVLWHQDGAYWNLEPMEALTVWLAIDDCDPSNGCLRMIPGSHRGKIGKVVHRTDVPNMLYSSIDQRLVDECRSVDVPLRAGDVSVHHPLIIHGSGPNRSPRRRCGLDIGYIRTTTRLGDTGLYLNPILVRGRAITKINCYRPWPEYSTANTITFRGCQRWNEYAREQNEQTEISTSQSDSVDVSELALYMIERLQAGTTKAVRAHVGFNTMRDCTKTDFMA